MVCMSRLIYGLHYVIRVSELLYINFHIFGGHFLVQNTFFGPDRIPVLCE